MTLKYRPKHSRPSGSVRTRELYLCKCSGKGYYFRSIGNTFIKCTGCSFEVGPFPTRDSARYEWNKKVTE